MLHSFLCKGCDREFRVPRKAGRPPTVCSPECRAEASRRQANAWYHANRDRAREQPSRQSAYRKAAFRAWYAKNREHNIQRSLAYARGPGKDSKRARDALRYALTKGSPGGELFTLDDIFIRDEGMCSLCGLTVDRRDATMDHVIPVTRGGPHTRANVKLAHRSCNTRKGNRLPAA